MITLTFELRDCWLIDRTLPKPEEVARCPYYSGRIYVDDLECWRGSHHRAHTDVELFVACPCRVKDKKEGAK